MINTLIWIYGIIAFIFYWYYKSEIIMMDNSDIGTNVFAKMSTVVGIEVLSLFLGAIWPLTLLTIGVGHDI